MTTLQVRRYSGTTKDAHGNLKPTYAAPADWTVWGLAPGEQVEPGVVRREQSDIAWTVYAPVSADLPTERDQVVVDGLDFAVDGRPEDWTRGPWPHPTAGAVVKLKRTEG